MYSKSKAKLLQYQNLYYYQIQLSPNYIFEASSFVEIGNDRNIVCWELTNGHQFLSHPYFSMGKMGKVENKSSLDIRHCDVNQAFQCTRYVCSHLCYLSSEVAPSPSVVGRSPCQALSSAAPVHYAARRYAAACTPALSSAQSKQRTERYREKANKEIMLYRHGKCFLFISFFKHSQIPTSSLKNKSCIHSMIPCHAGLINVY